MFYLLRGLQQIDPEETRMQLLRVRHVCSVQQDVSVGFRSESALRELQARVEQWFHGEQFLEQIHRDRLQKTPRTNHVREAAESHARYTVLCQATREGAEDQGKNGRVDAEGARFECTK